jgi:tetratricopeptide (TPR) repeat protein
MRTLLSVLIFSAAAHGAIYPLELQQTVGQIDRALRNFDLATAESLFQTACATPSIAASSAPCEYEAGAIAESREDDPGAVGHYRKAVERWQAADGPRVANRIVAMMNLGDVYRRLHNAAAAEQTFSDAMQLADSSPGLDPIERATLLERAAGLDGDLGSFDKAREKLTQSIAMLQGAGTEQGKISLTAALNALGMLELRLGDYKGGERELRQAVELATESLGENHPETAAYMTDLALALTVERQLSGAETLLRRARFVMESRLAPNSLRLVPVFAELGSVERETGRFRLAEEDTERALAILVHRIPYESAEITLTRVNLGSIYLRERKLPEADKVLTSAIEAERALYKSGRTLADGLRTLGALRVQQHHFPEAESLYREAIGLYETSIGGGHPDVAPVLREYANVLKRRKGPKAEIKTVETRIRTIETKAGRPAAS